MCAHIAFFRVKKHWSRLLPRDFAAFWSAKSGVKTDRQTKKAKRRGLTLAPGDYSRVCKQTVPSARAFSPPCVSRLRHQVGIIRFNFFRQSGCSFGLRVAAHGWDIQAYFPFAGRKESAEMRRYHEKFTTDRKSLSLSPPRRGRHARRPPRRSPAPCGGSGESPPSGHPCLCRGGSTPCRRPPSARRR